SLEAQWGAERESGNPKEQKRPRHGGGLVSRGFPLSPAPLTPVGIMNSYVRHQAHARQFTRPNWERLSRIPARCVAAVAFCLLRRYVANQPATSRLQRAGLHLPLS